MEMEFERIMLWLVVIIAIGMMLFGIWALCAMAKWADRHCTMQEPEGDQVDPWEQTVDREAGPGP
jgi:hypothetical protein